LGCISRKNLQALLSEEMWGVKQREESMMMHTFKAGKVEGMDILVAQIGKLGKSG
jgi:hypothetical protein